VAKQKGLQGWLKIPSPTPSGSSTVSKPTQGTKRTHEAISTAHVASDDEERPRKNFKSAGRQKVAKTVSGPRALDSRKTKQRDTSIIKNIDKVVQELNKRCKAQGPNGWSVTSDHYAAAMAKCIPDIQSLSNLVEGIKFAFNLMLNLGEYVHGDIDVSMKMSGYGGHEKPYKRLDHVMLELIERRNNDATEKAGKAGSALDTPPLSQVSPRWTAPDADVGDFKTGRPNKQQKPNGKTEAEVDEREE
jgi:hypothetical protein